MIWSVDVSVNVRKSSGRTQTLVWRETSRSERATWEFVEAKYMIISRSSSVGKRDQTSLESVVLLSDPY